MGNKVTTDTKKDPKYDVHDELNKDAFEIHGVMFSNKDIIQSACYCSNYIFDAIYDHDFSSGFMINISTSGWVSLAPITYNKKYSECLVRNSTDDKTILSSINKNAYINHSDTITVFLLTKGFFIDYFEIQPSEDDFIDEQSSTVVITSEDFERMTSKDPTLV